jgi:hypothetical protein
VFEGAKGSLRFFVHPDWRSLVHPDDMTYINDLLSDLPERAQHQSRGLFEQLNSLGVGPLVTLQTGEHLSNSPTLSDLCPQFIQL